MKKKPQTIADLKFNWTFYPSALSSLETVTRFQLLNPKLSQFKIKEGTYQFIVGDDKFSVDCFYSRPIRYFFEDVVYSTVSFIHSPLKLVKFELISGNTFKIHFKK